MAQQVVREVREKGLNTDVVSGCHVTGNEVVSLTEEKGVIRDELIQHYEMGSAPGEEKEDKYSLSSNTAIQDTTPASVSDSQPNKSVSRNTMLFIIIKL